MPTLAAFPRMLKRDRERHGLRVARAAGILAGASRGRKGHGFFGYFLFYVADSPLGDKSTTYAIRIGDAV